MKDITNQYIKKAIHIYDRTPDLQKIAKEKAKNFEIFTDFRDYVIENAKIIKQFKNISNDICQIIDSGNFAISRISSKIDQIKTVDQRADQIDTNINKVIRFSTNTQVAEFKELIVDCFNNLTFDTIDNYKTKLEDANRQLLEFIKQFEAVEDLSRQIKANISETKHLLTNEQVAEFEKLIEDCYNNMILGPMGSYYKSKLENANKQLREFIDKLKAVEYLISRIRTNISKTKSFFTNKQVAEFEKLIEDSFSDLTFGTIDNYKTKLENANKRLPECIANFQCCIAASSTVVGLKTDGTVVAAGENREGECVVKDWRNIVAVSSTVCHTVGLKADGTVICTIVTYNGNDEGQCNTDSWENIIAISASYRHTVGLKADGTVLAVGENKFKQCNTGSWRNIVAISAAYNHTVGLKADGTVVAIGDNAEGQCNTESWRDIVAISAGCEYTVGLKANGTVVAVGKNKLNQCNTGSWKNIVAISAGIDHTVGLKANGTVVSVGKNESGKCNTNSWKNIVAISAGIDHTVGLKTDGTVVAVGRSYLWQKNIKKTRSWHDIGPVNKELCLQQMERQAQGLCSHCGGKFSGLFSKKCTVCGRAKDY